MMFRRFQRSFMIRRIMQVCCGDVGQVILGKGKSLEVSSSFHRNMRVWTTIRAKVSFSSKNITVLTKTTALCVHDNCLVQPYLAWIMANALPVLIGSLLVTFISPVAAGSGIPVIKCYLNGVKIPEMVRIKTLIVKSVGVILSVVGGLAVGKEGPMVHCGAVIAAGISQGKSSTLKRDFKIFHEFRQDHEKRDFVSAGAAAGVAAAFGAPVGGVLFALEEGASFWNQALTWKIFFCSTVSAFTLSFCLSLYHGEPGVLSSAGLLNFGSFGSSVHWEIIEIPLYMFMGAIGGVLGAFYNYLNYRLSVFRAQFIHRKPMKVVEGVLVAVITATVAFFLIELIDDCSAQQDEKHTDNSLQFHCKDGKYSVIGQLWFQTPEKSVRSLFHMPEGTWSASTLSIFFVVYFIINCWTYGLSVSSGVFIPTLLMGAVFGRLFGIATKTLVSHFDYKWDVEPGKFALIGAAATLGGVVRMTLSLSVILIEATRDITFCMPIVITLIVAKWVGDYLFEGLYDFHFQLSRVPFLNWEAPKEGHHIYASEIMAFPVVTLPTVVKVGDLMDILSKTTHNGFPVTDGVDPETLYRGGGKFEEAKGFNEVGVSGIDGTSRPKHFGRFRGLILRDQLIVLLQNKIFNEMVDVIWTRMGSRDFREPYPRYSSVNQVHVSLAEREFHIDLRPFMNFSAYSISHNSSLYRIHKLFRALGLRHLTVVNDQNEVVGMITRKDLAVFRSHSRFGKTTLELLHISHG
ncbi:H(+)/Cl(-) exchange transporter 7-like isoform X3 [Varroa jacobsoni]|uniref:H(+)/Cl(-) exchange transporter 7-like isoform X3 n=1 Tax=Varroa jacobsoni TaxID=62625 RepID=UPI000BF2A8B8|nr:H(+)/Cl(-) exchange transporter 7-like isoform X3 [Varroa jacobsoni]